MRLAVLALTCACGRVGFDDRVPLAGDAPMLQADSAEQADTGTTTCTLPEPQLVQSSCTDVPGMGGASSDSLTLPAPVTAGNVIVVLADWDGTLAATVSDNLGTSYTMAGTYAMSATQRAGTWLGTSPGGTHTVRVDLGGASLGIGLNVLEYTPGAVVLRRITTGSSAMPSAPPATMQVGNVALLAHGVIAAAITSVRPDYNVVSRCNGNMVAEKVITAPTSPDVEFTADNSALWIVTLAALSACP